MQGPRAQSIPEGLVAASVATTLTLVYSAPTPGAGSRYLDGRVAHEARILSAIPVRDALAAAGGRGTGETVLARLRRSPRRGIPGPARPGRPARRALGPCPRRSWPRRHRPLRAGAGGR